MIEVNVIQGTPEWLRLRLGKITGTRLQDVFKSDNLTLVDELISEIETEIIDETFISKNMKNGKDLEFTAKQIYEKVKDISIEEVGFCLSKWNDYLALSPDGFTYDRIGAVEVKCPLPKTHVKYIRQNRIPIEYKYQVYSYFLVNEKLEWLDFISFCPIFKTKPMFIFRVYRCDIITELEKTKSGIIKFTDKLETYYKQVVS